MGVANRNFISKFRELDFTQSSPHFMQNTSIYFMKRSLVASKEHSALVFSGCGLLGFLAGGGSAKGAWLNKSSALRQSHSVRQFGHKTAKHTHRPKTSNMQQLLPHGCKLQFIAASSAVALTAGGDAGGVLATREPKGAAAQTFVAPNIKCLERLVSQGYGL